MSGNSFSFPFGLSFVPNQLDQLQGIAYQSNFPSDFSSNSDASRPNQNEEKVKLNAKKVTHACALCKKDHASCDSARPCKRCVGRGIPEQCVDAESKKRGRKKVDEEERVKKKASANKETHQQQQQQQHQISSNASNLIPQFLPQSESLVNQQFALPLQFSANQQRNNNNNHPNLHNNNNNNINNNLLSPSDFQQNSYKNNNGISPLFPSTSPPSSFYPSNLKQQQPITPPYQNTLQSISNNNLNNPNSYLYSNQLSPNGISSTSQSPALIANSKEHEIAGAYIPTASNRNDNNNNLYENFMDVLNQDNNEKPGDFMWLLDQMIPNYLQQSTNENITSDDPLSFLFSPTLSQRGNLFSSEESNTFTANNESSSTNPNTTVALQNSSVKRPRTPSYLKVEGLQVNPSIITPPEKESYDPAYESEQPPSLSIRSNETVFTMVRIMVAKGAISESDIYDHFAKLRTNADKIQDIREGISAEQKQAMKKDFEGFLNSFKTGAAQIGVPGMIWDRSGVVHYVNQSFIDMTGLSMKLPSAVDDYALLQIFSSSALREYSQFMRDNYFQPNVVKKILATGIKIWKKSSSPNLLLNQSRQKTSISTFCEGPYIEGTMCITIKRDVLGLPMIMFGHFLPSANSINQLSL
eukprot:TRINITY_DN5858_c0_g1_i1.p1 TRINITY_DN5858_c0_g1~~TRINITY_DN5858_c0_g1_i1.p1  ORF type:complete len:640 (-),score=180.92 TRINITY_DN5858_c0_g1_i1:120-2039(-)